MRTLPDYLREGLDIVFVGINPSAYSAQVGHYFARPQNRFWAALSRARVVPGSRMLVPEDDARLLDLGFGFTDVVKRPSRSASELRAADLRRWAPRLRQKLLRYRPLTVCFNGLMACAGYLRHTEGPRSAPRPGAQEWRIGTSHVFVVPSSSPANATVSLEALVAWYCQLGAFVRNVKEQGQPA